MIRGFSRGDRNRESEKNSNETYIAEVKMDE